jgi:hypothetical protein
VKNQAAKSSVCRPRPGAGLLFKQSMQESSTRHTLHNDHCGEDTSRGAEALRRDGMR